MAAASERLVMLGSALPASQSALHRTSRSLATCYARLVKIATSRKCLLAILFVLLCAGGGTCFAQSAQKIVDEYVRAEGGAKALARIQTAGITGSLTDDTTGQSGTYSLITKAPNKFYSEIIVGPRRMIEAYNGKSAWGQDTSGQETSGQSTDRFVVRLDGRTAHAHRRCGIGVGSSRALLEQPASRREEVQIRLAAN